MATRKIQNAKLPRPTSSFKATSNKTSLLGQGSGELGQNSDSHMDAYGDLPGPAEEWDQWRDYNGTFRANAMDPLPDFE